MAAHFLDSDYYKKKSCIKLKIMKVFSSERDSSRNNFYVGEIREKENGVICISQP